MWDVGDDVALVVVVDKGGVLFDAANEALTRKGMMLDRV